jgi:hypothetical protein
MPRRDEDEQRFFCELDAANVDAYTCLVYETWLGEKKDPATTVEEWMSVFLTEDLSDEYPTAAVVPNGTAPYKSDTSRYWAGYDGLEGSQADNKLRTIQEGDRDARKHQNDDQMMLDKERRAWSGGAAIAGVNYEDFLKAIDTVSADYEDEEAWTIIDTWRQRQLRTEERV